MPKKSISEFDNYLFNEIKELIFNDLKKECIGSKAISDREFLLLKKKTYHFGSIKPEIKNSYIIQFIKIKRLEFKYWNSRTPYTETENEKYEKSDKSSKKHLFSPKIKLQEYSFDLLEYTIEEIMHYKYTLKIKNKFINRYKNYIYNYQTIDIKDFKLKDIKEYIKKNGHSLIAAK